MSKWQDLAESADLQKPGSFPWISVHENQPPNNYSRLQLTQQRASDGSVETEI